MINRAHDNVPWGTLSLGIHVSELIVLNLVEQSPFWEANSHSASQEITCLL
jgi:hypothetical protein